MIRRRLTIPGTDTSVSKPVVDSILNRIKQIFCIDQDISTVVTTDGVDYVNEYWNLGNETGNTSGQYSMVLTCDYDEVYDDKHAITTRVRKNDTEPIILDAEVGMLMRPLKIETIGELTLVLYSKSKNEISSVAEAISMIYISNRDSELHDIEFLYYLPIFALDLIKSTHTLKQKGGETTIDLVDYIRDIMAINGTSVGRQDGDVSKTELAFKERQTKVLGYFKGETLNNKIVFDKDKGYWTLEFKYIYRYDRPAYIDAIYRNTIFNNLLPRRYLDVKDKENTVEHLTNSQEWFEGILTSVETRAIEAMKKKNDAYVQIPQFVTLSTPGTNYQTVRIFNTIVLIDDFGLTKNYVEILPKKHILFNVSRLPDIQINHLLLDFILTNEVDQIGEYDNSPIFLELYADSERVDTVVKVDSGGYVYVYTTLDKSKEYSVMLNITPDLSNLNHAAVKRLKSHDLYNEVYRYVLTSDQEGLVKERVFIDDFVIDRDPIRLIPKSVQVSWILAQFIKSKRK